jgi:hypothetical protein
MSGVYARAFEPAGATQNVAMDGTAKTLTFDAGGDKNSVFNVVVSGTAVAFARVDSTTPTTTNAKPMLANTDQNISRPVGNTTIKLIGAAGSTVYVTAGRGV